MTTSAIETICCDNCNSACSSNINHKIITNKSSDLQQDTLTFARQKKPTPLWHKFIAPGIISLTMIGLSFPVVNAIKNADQEGK